MARRSRYSRARRASLVAPQAKRVTNMAKVGPPIHDREPRKYMVFNHNGFVEGFVSESAAEIFARAASKNAGPGARYTVFRLKEGGSGMPVKCSEFSNGRRI